MTLPRRRAGLTASVVAGEAVVLDPRTDTAHRLDATAAAVWQACGTGESQQAIATRLGVPSSQVRAACDELLALDLVEVPGQSRRTVLKGGALAAGAVFVSSVAIPRAAAAASNPGGGGGGGGGPFIDISHTGTRVFGPGTDDDRATVTADFAITLYGISTANPTVSSNGNVQLNSSDSAFTNTPLPDAYADFGATAFVFWDDLYLRAGDGVYVQTIGPSGGRTFIVQWNTHQITYFSSQFVFQAQFFEAVPGKVVFVYQNVVGEGMFADGGSSATIGVEKSSAGPAVLHSFNTASVHNGDVLTFNT